MKKVLVTGGGGFIGSYVIEELLGNGIEVLIFDHVYPGVYSMRLGAHDDVEHFVGDVMDPVAVTEAAAHVDGIIHLAAVLGTQETIQNPRPSASTNILGSLNVFEAANQYGLPVVYAGVGNYWMREHGAGSYTISKTAVEDYARMFNKFRGGNISVVRPVNAYGPRQSVAAPYGTSKVRKIIPSFVCRALTGDDIEIYGDGTQISDCVHVYDVARVFVRTLRLAATEGPFTGIEVGPRSPSSVNEVACIVRDEAMDLGYPESILTYLPMRPGEVPNAVVSANQDPISVLGSAYSPDTFISLREGLAETVQWYADQWLPEFLVASR